MLAFINMIFRVLLPQPLIEANRIHQDLFKIFKVLAYTAGLATIFNIAGGTYQYLLLVNIGLGYIAFIAMLYFSTKPKVIASIFAVDLLSKRMELTEETLFEHYIVFIKRVLLYTSLIFFIMGTFSFKEYPVAIPVIFLGAITLYLMDLNWGLKTKLAKPFLYSYVFVVIIMSITLAVPDAIYEKQLGWNPKDYIRIEASDSTKAKIISKTQKIQEDKANYELDKIYAEIESKLDDPNFIKNHSQEEIDKWVADMLKKAESIKPAEDSTLKQASEGVSAAGKSVWSWGIFPWNWSLEKTVIEPKPIIPNKSVKIYPPGTHTIVLKAGETTDHWIMFPDGRKTKYSFDSDGLKFILTYSNGKQYNAWELKQLPKNVRAKFKITAVDDQVIKMPVI